MKKIVIGAVVLSAFAFASCKKTYTCECITSSTILGVTTTSTASTDITDSKSNATTECDKGDAYVDLAGVSTTEVECELK